MSPARSHRAAGQPKAAAAPLAENFTANTPDEPDAAAEAPAAEAPDPVLHDATPPVSPNFAMSDDEAVPPQFLRVPSPPPAAQDAPPVTRPAAAAPAKPAGPVVYEHRIRVLEAFHYEGILATAPAWVSRDWVAWGDYDEARRLPAGPALNVPSPRHPTGYVLCRKGDYVVRQEITLAPGVDPDVQVEVWQQGEFERLFVPVREHAQLVPGAAGEPPFVPVFTPPPIPGGVAPDTATTEFEHRFGADGKPEFAPMMPVTEAHRVDPEAAP